MGSQTVNKVSAPDFPLLRDLEEEPMAELQVLVAIWVYQILDRYFKGQSVYVVPEMPVPFQQEDQRVGVRPDVMVVRDVPDVFRERYAAWEEGKPVDWALEVASRSTARTDWDKKPDRYRALGVPELVLFDPEATFHPRVLTVYRLGQDGYESVEPNEQGRFESEVLGLELAAVQERKKGKTFWMLRLFVPGQGTALPTNAEWAAASDAERARMELQKNEAEYRKNEAEHRKNEAEHRKNEAEAERDEGLARLAIAEKRIQELERALEKTRSDDST